MVARVPQQAARRVADAKKWRSKTRPPGAVGRLGPSDTRRPAGTGLQTGRWWRIAVLEEAEDDAAGCCAMMMVMMMMGDGVMAGWMDDG